MTEVQQWCERESRSSTSVRAIVTGEKGSEVSVSIVDVSNRGCRFKSDEAFEVNEAVKISMPRLGAVSAKIRWSDDGCYGAEFVAGSEEWEEAEDPDPHVHPRRP